MIADDLPKDLPSFIGRFGTDSQCRDYLFHARWPEGFRCAGCGHDDAYALKTKIVYECVACRKQHSLLAGSIFEQTKTGLAKWFLAIYLFAVGTLIAERPPHRSVRAGFPHTAPTSGV